MTRFFRFLGIGAGSGGRASGAAPPAQAGTGPRRWETLDEATQTALRIEFGHHLDGLPPTCSLQAKRARFRDWLALRNVCYTGETD